MQSSAVRGAFDTETASGPRLRRKEQRERVNSAESDARDWQVNSSWERDFESDTAAVERSEKNSESRADGREAAELENADENDRRKNRRERWHESGRMDEDTLNNGLGRATPHRTMENRAMLIRPCHFSERPAARSRRKETQIVISIFLHLTHIKPLLRCYSY
jgi:hypothetical protein